MNRRTRQRQGRDFPPFSIHEYLKSKANTTGIIPETADDVSGEDYGAGDGHRKSVLETLERLRAEAEETAVPVDGHEPPERGR